MEDYFPEREKQIRDFESELNNKLRRIANFPPYQAYADNYTATLDDPINILIKLADSNTDLKKDNSDYYRGDIESVIHFTSLRTLFSILNEKSLRLYNLKNVNDTNEFTFTAIKLGIVYETLGYSEEQVVEYFSKIKNRSFILSTSDISEIYNDRCWDEYADNGHGVAIEFKIVNDPLKWNSCHISKIRYENLDWSDEFIRIISDYKRDHQSHTITFELNHILCFHKEPIKKWIAEKEIRILITKYENKLFNNIWNNLIFSDYNLANQEIVEYFKLPLYTENEESLPFIENEFQFNHMNNCFPSLRISKIIFGPAYKYSTSLHQDFDQIKSYFLEKFGYYPTIERISMKK